MPDLQILYQRNRKFTKNFTHGDLVPVPAASTMVLTCFDSRVDPTYFFGLELGEAVVLRNAGGRVTDQVERDVAFLWGMASNMANGRSPQLSLAVVHHLDCGLERLAQPEFERAINQSSGISVTTLRTMAIKDHARAIENDIERLRHSNLVPGELVVSGHLYDPKRGHLNQVLAPIRLR